MWCSELYLFQVRHPEPCHVGLSHALSGDWKALGELMQAAEGDKKVVKEDDDGLDDLFSD